MSDQTIFDGTTTTTDGANGASDPVAELVGEGKKYKSTEAALASIPHKEKHISVLEAENAELRKKLEQNQESVDEILQRLREQDRKPFSAPEPEEKKYTDTPQVPIEELIKTALEKKEKEDKFKNNIEKADTLMKEKFGNKASDVLLNKANELGVSVSVLAGVAAQSPKAFMEYFKSEQVTNPTFTNATINSEAITNGGTSGTRGKTYWDNMRRTNYNEYMSPKMQELRFNDRSTLGKNYDKY